MTIKFAVVRIMLAAGATLLLSTNLAAEDQAEKPTVGPSDQTFLTQAAEGGAAEVKFGELGKDRAERPEIREFAKLMIKDHSDANRKLMKLAKSKYVDIPTTANPAAVQSFEKLKRLTGLEFDRAYMDQMVQDHNKAIAEFERASKSSQDADVKQFATETLPTLKQHLSHAQTVDLSAGEQSTDKREQSADKGEQGAEKK